MQVSDLQPISLFILLAGGMGIVYVVRLFIASIAANNERMWSGLKEINQQWLEWAERASKDASVSVKSSNDVNRELAREIAGQTKAISELTAAISRSVEGGHNLNGAASLMVSVLEGVKKEHETRK